MNQGIREASSRQYKTGNSYKVIGFGLRSIALVEIPIHKKVKRYHYYVNPRATAEGW